MSEIYDRKAQGKINRQLPARSKPELASPPALMPAARPPATVL